MSSNPSEKKPTRRSDGAIRSDAVLIARPRTLQAGEALKSEDLTLLEHIDGRKTVDEVLQASGLSSFLGMRRLRWLYEREFVDSSSGQANRGTTPRGLKTIPSSTPGLSDSPPEDHRSSAGATT